MLSFRLTLLDLARMDRKAALFAGSSDNTFISVSMTPRLASSNVFLTACMFPTQVKPEEYLKE